MQVLRVGDLVAHKHYPKKAIGKISKFYDSGRVGVDDGCRPRSFLPGSLLLWHGAPEPVAPISPGEVEEEVEDAIAHSEVIIAPAQKTCPECGSYDVSEDDFISNFYWCGNCHYNWDAEVKEEVEDAIAPEEIELPPAQTKSPERYESCRRCESRDLSYFTYQDPDEYYYYCHNCGYAEWVAGSPPAQEVDAIATDEMIERPPTHPLSLFQKFDLVASLSEMMELLPVPRDLIPEQMPEWWEKPFLQKIFKVEPDDDDEDEYYWNLVDPGYFNAKYRDWNLLIEEKCQIYATEPDGKKCWWCEYKRELDGRDGQIAIAQEFIDSWYFAQPSPGQLSLNIIEAVARDPPTRPLLRLTA